MTMLTASDVAQQLAISPRKVYALAASGELASHRFGAAVRFSQVDVDVYVESCRLSARTRGPILRANPRTLHLKAAPMQSELQAYFAARRVKLREKPPKR